MQSRFTPSELGSLKRSAELAPAFDETAAFYDVCFVMNVNSKGWILDKICKVIADTVPGPCYFVYSERNDVLSEPLPRARNYFFAHFAVAYFTMKKHPDIFSGNCYVWFTHPDLKKGMRMDDVLDMAKACTRVFTPCSRNKDGLSFLGLPEDLIDVPLGGADPSQFKAKKRDGDGAVGFVSAYYERKQPDKMLDIMKAMPDVPFILLGPCEEGLENKGLLWRNWSRFDELMALPNLEYVEANYDAFPQWYQKFDVLCSTSLLEGGPIPAVEAMMSNVIPVISDTGFARDIVTHGETGFVFPVDDTVENIENYLRKALSMTEVDVASVAQNYSWRNFAQEIWEGMCPPLALGQKIHLDDPVNAPRYLQDGFHPPETRGVWTRSKIARLSLPLKAEGDAQFVKVFAWAPADLGDKTLELTLRVVGGETVSYQIGKRPKELRVPVPGTAIVSRHMYLEMHTSSVLRPNEHNPEVADDRSLGVKLGWVSVE